jgi:hypothetical protein
VGSIPTAGIVPTTNNRRTFAERTWQHTRRRIGVASAMSLALSGVSYGVPGALVKDANDFLTGFLRLEEPAGFSRLGEVPQGTAH